MQVGFLVPKSLVEKRPYKVQRLRDELERAGHQVVMVEIGELETTMRSGEVSVRWRGERLPDFNLFYWAFEWDDTDAWEIVRAVEEAGYTMFMSTGLPLGDKVTQAFLLSKAGVEIPETEVVSLNRLGLVRGKLKYPLVFKGRYGSRGEQVRWVVKFEEIAGFVAELKLPADEPFVLQQVVSPVGQDVRALVVGDKVVAAMVRTAVAGEFRSNYSLQGKVAVTTLGEDEVRAVLAAHRAFGCPVSGVDFMRSERGPVVLEVNMWPGIEGVEEATGLNVGGEIAALMVAAAKV